MNAAPDPRNESPSPVLPAERRFVWAFALLVMLVTSLPYVLGFSTQGEETRFSGFVFGVEDGNSYIAKMLSGWAGAWLFRTPYTADPQNGLLFYFPYILLGKLAAPPALHEQLVAWFHLARFAAGLFSIWATYDFLAYFIRSVRLRRIGLALAVLGGGLGWLLVLLGQEEWLGSVPLDFTSPEAFGFLGLYGLAHLPMARALFLWTLLAYLDLFNELRTPPANRPALKASIRKAGRLSILWLLGGLFNPLSLAVSGLVILIHFLGVLVRDGWRRLLRQPEIRTGWLKIGGQLAAAGLLPGLFLAYNLIVSMLDPYASAWTAQNLIRSPHPAHLAVAYGLMIPYAWAGARSLLRNNFDSAWLLVGWVLLLPVLFYAPLGLQRRLTEGYWIALVALGAAGLERGSEQPSSRQPLLKWRLAPFLLLFPTSLILLAGGFQTVLDPRPPRFVPADQAHIFEHLQAQAAPGTVVLSAYQTANPLPAWAPVRVLAGHGPESIRKDELLPQIESFYQIRTPDEDRLALIDRFNIQYVFWGPAERSLGDWQPDQTGYLELAAQQGEYRLYRVVGGNP